MADTPVGSEAARKAALVAQVASWKVKEAARLEKRRRDRLVVSGAARETTVGSSRGSSPGITNTRSAGRQNGSYQGASFTQDQFSGGQKQGGALLFRPEEIQHLPGPFSEEERNAWELDLADEWDSMNKYEVGTPEFLTARQWIEDFSQVLQTRIRNSNPIANRQSEQIQQMKQNLGFNARGTYNFNTRTAMQTSSLPASSNPEYRPTYTRMARRHLSVETLRHFNVDFRVDEYDADYLLVKRWVPEHEQVKLWEHTRDLREIRRSSLRFVESASPRPPSRSSGESEDHTFYTLLSSTTVDVLALKALGYLYVVNSNGSITVEGDLDKSQIDQIKELSSMYGEGGSKGFAGSSKESDQFATIRQIPGHQRSGAGLRIENSTISQDNVVGKEARQAELLALYGKKQFTLAFRSLNYREEMELVDPEDKPRGDGDKARASSGSYDHIPKSSKTGVVSNTRAPEQIARSRRSRER